MTQKALILGTHGRFGAHAALAFQQAGWGVTRFDRARDDLAKSASDVDVVVNGWNPPDYSTWAREMLPLHNHVIAALTGTRATVIVPGNVYVFGQETPRPWSEETPHRAQNPLGRLRIEMERAYRNSSVPTIILRAGDFIDTRASGNWFDRMIVSKLRAGRLVYPGALDQPHAWAYLPDLARAAVMLAERREQVPRFCDVSFPGYTLTAQEMATLIGPQIRARQMAWWPIRLLALASPGMRGLLEMRYLWDTPHSLDGRRLAQLLPEFQPTPPEVALQNALQGLGLGETQAKDHAGRVMA